MPTNKLLELTLAQQFCTKKKKTKTKTKNNSIKIIQLLWS